VTDDLDDRWRPLNVRESGDHTGYDTLHPGVPPWLQDSLWQWVAVRISSGNPSMPQIERVFRMTIGRTNYIGDLRARAFRDPEFFLELVDYVASKLSLSSDPVSYVRTLNDMLDEAGSEWTLDDTSGRYGLVRRVPLEVRAAADQVMNTGDKAAQHLRLAWNAVYGRHPDPSKSYRESIKALEVATIPVILPTDRSATLGKVIRAMRDKPSKWAVRLKHDDHDRQVEIVADMLDLVWKGQSDRHGDPDPNTPISVTLEQAEEV
jgi:hypothetical protein